MTYIKTDPSGRVETVFKGPVVEEEDGWVEVESDLLDAGTAYLISESEEPQDGWDEEDGTIGVVK